MTDQNSATREHIGLVVIGRNEGDRLKRCLASASGHVSTIVYVDSGSTDDSVSFARSHGVHVVELDMTVPFTAARARNSGFRKLLEIEPGLELVQFVDGDVEIVDAWLDAAAEYLHANEKAAAVSGRRRERHPDQSVFNRLCDIEWNKPPNYPACEGDALMRVAAFREVDGFNESLIAGEEPELCLRLRNRGWQILRVPDEMTLHDAAILRLSQWWRRESRAGYAFAEGAAMYGRAHYLRQSLGIYFWAVAVPLLAIGLAWPTQGLSLALLLGYGVLFMRSYRGLRPRAACMADGMWAAAFNVLGKWAMLAGQLRFWSRRVSGRTATLIEYKTAGEAA